MSPDNIRSADGARLALSDLRALAFHAVVAGASGDDVMAATAEGVRVGDRLLGRLSAEPGRHRRRPSPGPQRTPP